MINHDCPNEFKCSDSDSGSASLCPSDYRKCRICGLDCLPYQRITYETKHTEQNGPGSAKEIVIGISILDNPFKDPSESRILEYVKTKPSSGKIVPHDLNSLEAQKILRKYHPELANA